MEQRSLAPAWLSFDKKPPSGRPRATRPGHASSTNTSSRPSAASWSQVLNHNRLFVDKLSVSQSCNASAPPLGQAIQAILLARPPCH
eukprot:m.58742 g.58742  ORF g.58742 m.58742 type:complete len:87 (+) comp13787_c0_seq3:183-443(+)